jgi:DNA-binding response OmpR family regulator
MQGPITYQLTGKRILVVEDDPLIAMAIVEGMTDEGVKVIGPAETVDAALDAIANTNLDGATLNIKLGDNRNFQIADVLAERSVPFVFFTGYGAADIPVRHANVTRLEKPTMPYAVCRALEKLLAAHIQQIQPPASPFSHP